METASPLRRRAALASLDANAMPHFQTESKSTPNAMATAAKIVADSILAAGKKRGSPGVDGSPVNKKTCLSSSQTGQSEDAEEASSPAASSVFDNSEDASWSTTATEIDGPTRTRGVSLTREQARERAEILRLRLGLASYKVRTGQISVPLADLQPKPIPRTFSPASPAVEVSSSPQQTQEQQSTQQTSTHGEDDASVVPESSQESNGGADEEEAGTPAKSTLQENVSEEELMDSARKGGAVSGLLSLSRGDA